RLTVMEKNSLFIVPALLVSKHSSRFSVSNRSLGKNPIGPGEVTGVTVWIALQIVLMFRFGFPEITNRCQLGNDHTRPQTRSIHISNCLLRHFSLFVARIENRRSVAHA